ncbi:hypothetical protein VTH06DRAFT_1643 [Thermothelomyces fergusii]
MGRNIARTEGGDGNWVVIESNSTFTDSRARLKICSTVGEEAAPKLAAEIRGHVLLDVIGARRSSLTRRQNRLGRIMKSDDRPGEMKRPLEHGALGRHATSFVAVG